MVYAYLQLGQDKNGARRDRREWRNRRASVPMCRARHSRLLRHRRATWSSAATGKARRSSTCGRPSSPTSTAITHFARALGAARSGKPDAAQADVAKLAELRDKLREPKDAYWAEQVDIQGRIATPGCSTRRARRRGASRPWRRRRRRGQDREGAVTPGPLAPAREL
jgi:hypothetical protein